MVGEADEMAKADLETLINDGTIEKPVHEDITYGDIHQTQDNLWNFLFFTGYLKKISERKDESGETLYLTMAIPNTEIKTIYKNSIAYWFEQRMKETDRSPLKHALETGDCEAAEDFINSQLADTISYYDYAENFYHGFMAGNPYEYRRLPCEIQPRERKRQTRYRDDGIKIQRQSDDSGAEGFGNDQRHGEKV